MNESLSRNRNTIITTAGVVVFLAAGMLTMLFFPRKSERQLRHEASQAISQPATKEADPSKDIATVPEPPKPKAPKPDWYVYVVGEVKNPGYYKISADSRVFQAIQAAGGFTSNADQTSVNMASLMADGLQITVAPKGVKKPVAQSRVAIPGLAPQRSTPLPIAARQPQPQSDSGLVDINNATQKELEQLKGVGPAIAKRIVDYRNANGRFSSPEDLIKVKGIGSAKLEKMRSQILIR